jgi:hypothetical protein
MSLPTRLSLAALSLALLVGLLLIAGLSPAAADPILHGGPGRLHPDRATRCQRPPDD